jgi:hypothetical protein
MQRARRGGCDGDERSYRRNAQYPRNHDELFRIPQNNIFREGESESPRYVCLVIARLSVLRLYHLQHQRRYPRTRCLKVVPHYCSLPRNTTHTGGTPCSTAIRSGGKTGEWHSPSVSVRLVIDAARRSLVSDYSLIAGSLFNRSDTPNVSYSIDTATESIRFTTARAVEPDEEFCVRYSHDPSLSSDDDNAAALVGDTPNHVLLQATPDPNEILPDDDLPFTRVKMTSDEDNEETPESVRTGEHVPPSQSQVLQYRPGPSTSQTHAK